jgi:hypothetical protein
VLTHLALTAAGAWQGAGRVRPAGGGG